MNKIETDWNEKAIPWEELQDGEKTVVFRGLFDLALKGQLQIKENELLLDIAMRKGCNGCPQCIVISGCFDQDKHVGTIQATFDALRKAFNVSRIVFLHSQKHLKVLEAKSLDEELIEVDGGEVVSCECVLKIEGVEWRFVETSSSSCPNSSAK